MENKPSVNLNAERGKFIIAVTLYGTIGLVLRHLLFRRRKIIRLQAGDAQNLHQILLKLDGSTNSPVLYLRYETLRIFFKL